jgi:hypothetical protein
MRRARRERVADIVQCGPFVATVEGTGLTRRDFKKACKCLILLALLAWLAALDDVRNWLICEAA